MLSLTLLAVCKAILLKQVMNNFPKLKLARECNAELIDKGALCSSLTTVKPLEKIISCQDFLEAH